MSTRDDILAVHSALVDAADEETDYEAAWSLRFDAGYTAALFDMLELIGRGESPIEKVSAWVRDYDYLLDNDDN